MISVFLKVSCYYRNCILTSPAFSVISNGYMNSTLAIMGDHRSQSALQLLVNGDDALIIDKILGISEIYKSLKIYRAMPCRYLAM